ncbi:hypothetical protein ACFE04_020685 [Oxalis oulophora]
MFTSSKGKGKQKTSTNHVNAVRAIYDHNESQITLAKSQYDNLKNDMITVMSRMRNNQLNTDAMNCILLQPTLAVKAHEIFWEMLSEETDEETPKQTTVQSGLSTGRSKKGKNNYINLG